MKYDNRINPKKYLMIAVGTTAAFTMIGNLTEEETILPMSSYVDQISSSFSNQANIETQQSYIKLLHEIDEQPLIDPIVQVPTIKRIKIKLKKPTQLNIATIENEDGFI